MTFFTQRRAKPPIATTPTSKTPILLISDNPGTINSVSSGLDTAGFAVLVCKNAADACQMIAMQAPQIAICELADARERNAFCRQLRACNATNIILLTPRDDTQAIIAGLNAGADDCIAAPVTVAELVARIAAILRRTRTEQHRLSERVAV